MSRFRGLALDELRARTVHVIRLRVPVQHPVVCARCPRCGCLLQPHPRERDVWACSCGSDPFPS